MKLEPSVLRVENQLILAPEARSAHTPRASPKRLCSTVVALNERSRKVSYIPGERPIEEAFEAPRLFIRGAGGSLKMDLSGVGTCLSKAAFAHQVPDDSLASIHIHRGDIVLIEPSFRALRPGNLVLLEVDGRAVLRRLTKISRIWYLNALGNSGSAPVPLIDQPLQGVALGFVRLFTPLKPVKFRGADSNCEISFMRLGDEASTRKKPRPAAAKPSSSKALHAKTRQRASLLAAEWKGKFCLSEVERKSGYTARPNNR